jgi:hypothetical protein
MRVAGTAVLAVALIGLTAACGASGEVSPSTAAPAASTSPAAVARARLLPVTGDPFRVRGSGFRPRERVRVTITATSSGARVTRRVRATGSGTFGLAFSGVRACAGIEGVAAGSRGSRASFQLSSLRC